MKIALGSTSKHKLDAVHEACQQLGLPIEIQGVKTSSGVNEQPVGFEETFEGALARAEEVQDQFPGVIALGIESGIFRLGENNIHTLDLAVIVLILPTGKKIVTTSSGVQFPEVCVREADRRGFDTTTVGSIVTEKFGGDPTDPHSVLTNGKVTRKKTLVDALVIALRQI